MNITSCSPEDSPHGHRKQPAWFAVLNGNRLIRINPRSIVLPSGVTYEYA